MGKTIKKMIVAASALYAFSEFASAFGRAVSAKDGDIDALFPDAAEEIKQKIEEAKGGEESDVK